MSAFASVQTPSSGASPSSPLPAPSASARWIALHVHLSGGFNRYLRTVLSPLLQDPEVAGRLGRFFFIRYSEGGHHIRLRLRPSTPADRDPLLDAATRHLQAGLERMDAAVRDHGRVERAEYDRTAHYFGPTWASVYAELLNEQTSILALRLLQREPDDGPARFAWLTAMAHVLTADALPNPHGAATAFREDWLQFAERVCRDHYAAHVDVDAPPDAERMAAWDPVMAQTVPAARRALTADPTANRIRHLVQRLRRHPDPQRRFTAVHAMHLLYNKLSYSLPRELLAVRLLRRHAGESIQPS